jgi:hypothetical protein
MFVLFACIFVHNLTYHHQSSDYDHGQGLTANGFVKALIPVLSALAVHVGKIGLAEEMNSLGCDVPDVDSETLDRAIAMITAAESLRLDRALAMAACVHQTAANSVRYFAGFGLWWVLFFWLISLNRALTTPRIAEPICGSYVVCAVNGDSSPGVGSTSRGVATGSGFAGAGSSSRDSR